MEIQENIEEEYSSSEGRFDSNLIPSLSAQDEFEDQDDDVFADRDGTINSSSSRQSDEGNRNENIELNDAVFADVDGTITSGSSGQSDGLETKVKLWASNKDTCHKMSGHWRDKEHWFKRNEGLHLKKEVWDGDRFAELSWLFDPESHWCLPVRCEMEQCMNIISPEIIESLPEITPGVKQVICAVCHYAFTFTPKYAYGDPRNIALIGHWDGFQPFGLKSRSTAQYREAQKHYYYPCYREAFRIPLQTREILQELTDMMKIEQEERVTVAADMSKES